MPGTLNFLIVWRCFVLFYPTPPPPDYYLVEVSLFIDLDFILVNKVFKCLNRVWPCLSFSRNTIHLTVVRTACLSCMCSVTRGTPTDSSVPFIKVLSEQGLASVYHKGEKTNRDFPAFSKIAMLFLPRHSARVFWWTPGLGI